jgi:hypothetical protein
LGRGWPTKEHISMGGVYRVYRGQHFTGTGLYADAADDTHSSTERRPFRNVHSDRAVRTTGPTIQSDLVRRLFKDCEGISGALKDGSRGHKGRLGLLCIGCMVTTFS